MMEKIQMRPRNRVHIMKCSHLLGVHNERSHCIQLLLPMLSRSYDVSVPRYVIKFNE